MKTVYDRGIEILVGWQDEIRRGIEFIESGSRLYVPKGELERMKAMLSALDASVEKAA